MKDCGLGKILFAVTILLLLLWGSDTVTTIKELGLPEQTQYYIYCKRYEGTDSALSCGNGRIVRVEGNVEREMRNSFGVDGVSVRFETSRDKYDQLLDRIGLVVGGEFDYGDMTSVYGFSPRFGKGVLVDGRYVNVQVSFCGGIVQIGTPLLLGSF